MQRLGVTQTALADHLGIHKGDVSKLLSGKLRIRLATFRKIEAFLAQAERKAQPRGVAESPHTRFEHKPPSGRCITLEEALALKANPPPKLPAEERERLIRELVELSEAYKLLPRANTMTDDEILGYDEFGIPSQ